MCQWLSKHSQAITLGLRVGAILLYMVQIVLKLVFTTQPVPPIVPILMEVDHIVVNVLHIALMLLAIKSK